MAFGVASVVLQENCRIRCTAEDFGSVHRADHIARDNSP